MRRIDHYDVINQLKQLWESDFLATTETIHSMHPDMVDENTLTWSQVEAELSDAISEIEVRAINGFAKEALDYADSAVGLKVIAVGGDKLARGLTLEGLCVSYFLRASRMYDTLMQMGRWFGYRPGYLDLCRLYTTIDLVEWFEHIADASEELREEFDLMTASGATPKEYGLKVASHPVLMVTSRLKMRNAQSLYLSFSGQSVETVSLLKDLDSLKSNLQAFDRLTLRLGEPKPIPDRNRNGSKKSGNGVQWTNVPAEVIVQFLSEYKTHPAAMKVNSRLLSDFIQNMNKEHELTSWTVAIINGGQERTYSIYGSSSVTVKLVKRTPKTITEDRYSIGRLLSPADEALDLDDDAWDAALNETRNNWKNDPARSEKYNGEPPKEPNGPALRKVRGFGAGHIAGHPERGLLLIYLLSPEGVDDSYDESTAPIVSFGISFPGSDSGTKVKYEVNNVLWEQEYDPSVY